MLQREDHYRYLFENAPLGYQALDQAGRLIVVNRAWLEELGYEEHEVLGRWFGEFLQPDSRERFENNFPRFKVEGTASGVEYAMNRKDGTAFGVQITGRVSRNGDGSFRQTHCILRNVSEERRMEERIRRAERLYHSIVEDQTEMICRFTPDGTITFGNDAFLRAFDLRPHQLAETTFMARVSGEDAAAVEPSLRALTPDHPVCRLERRIAPPSGDERWQRWTVRAFFDDTGRLLEYQGVGRDNTQEARWRHALEASERNYRALAENSLQGIALFNEQGVVYANPALGEIVGYTPGELTAMSPAEVFAIAHPEDRTAIRRTARRILNRQERPSVYELQAVRRDGGDLRLEIGVSVILREGRRALQVYVLDRSEHRKAVEALRKSEELFRQLAEGMVDGVWSAEVDEEGRTWIDYVNPAFERILRITADEILRSPRVWVERLFPEDRDGVLKRLEGFLRDGTGYDVEYRIVLPDASVRWIWARAYRIGKAGGRPFRVVGTAQDVTERKRLLEESSRHSRHLQSFSGNLISAQEAERRRISRSLHEVVGQTLTALRMNLSALSKHTAASRSPETNELLRDSEGLAEQILHHVHELSLDLHPRMLDELGLVSTIRWYLSRWSKRTGLKVEFDAKDLRRRPPETVETVLYRVMQEAFNNVVKHARATHVWVRLDDGENVVRLSVRDNGEGFDAEEEPADTVPETGIGLLDMRESVALIGGAFDIHSRPGAGTVVRIEIPMS